MMLTNLKLEIPYSTNRMILMLSLLTTMLFPNFRKLLEQDPASTVSLPTDVLSDKLCGLGHKWLQLLGQGSP